MLTNNQFKIMFFIFIIFMRDRILKKNEMS